MSITMDKFKTLLDLQNDHVHSLSQTTVNFKKLGRAKWTQATIKARIDKTHQLWKTIQDEHRSLRAAAARDDQLKHEYFTLNLFQEYEGIYDETIDFFVNLLNDNQPTVQSAESDVEELSVHCNASFRLPPITMTKFNGTLTEWEAFKGRFETLVVNNRKLDNMQRMYHLVSSLEDEARSKIDHLELTKDNFPIA